MRLVVCDTSLFLAAADQLALLPRLFGEVWVPGAVLAEIEEGVEAGHPAVDLEGELLGFRAAPAADPLPGWLARDLGAGELAVMSAALEAGPGAVVLLDDRLARRVAEGAGLVVWGTLRVLLEGKKAGHLGAIGAGAHGARRHAPLGRPPRARARPGRGVTPHR